MITLKTRIVTIPEKPEHNGMHSVDVRLVWTCPICGEPRPDEVTTMDSYDGSRRLPCSSWKNPCGHLIKYTGLFEEAKLNGLNDALACFGVHLNHEENPLVGISISQGNLREYLNQGLKLYSSKSENGFQIESLNHLYWSTEPLATDDYLVTITLWTRGEKSEGGSYGTPVAIVDEQLDLTNPEHFSELTYELDLELGNAAFNEMKLGENVLFLAIHKDQTQFNT